MLFRRETVLMRNRIQYLKTVLIIFIILTALYSKTYANKPLWRIFYIANVNGVIENCRCTEPSLGGLDYLHGTLMELKEDSIPHIFIDGGDFCNPYPYPLLNRTVLSIYQKMRPDIMVLGDQDINELNLLKNNYRLWPGTSILGTNIKLSNLPMSTVQRYDLPDNLSLNLVSYLDNKAFDFIEQPEQLKFEGGRFDSVYHSLPERQTINGLIYHGPARRLNPMIQKYPKFDFLLLGHSQYKGRLEGYPLPVIGGGTDGHYLIEIRVISEQSLVKFEIMEHQVDLSKNRDSRIHQMIQRFKGKVNRQ
ncbi:MAG: hypothetical protein GF313_12750 [Caldithrix sp.]|nr:hypothetical protein [Caldithrix sp.]